MDKLEAAGRIPLGRRTDGNLEAIDFTPQYSAREKSILQILSISAAALSVSATLISLYWLLRMRQMFRHRLISLVILGDFIKSFFHLIVAIVIMTNERFGSKSIVCQITGVLVHLGAEISDFAVFFVSLHIALQALGVTRINVDGLYRYRHSVYAANLLLPCILVSLVFTKSKRPYVPEGSFCNLPIRPFGYRLALSWIPRYIVWISILSIAITIYVKTKFKLDMFEAVEMESSRSFRANSAFSHVIKKSVKEDRCKPSGQGLRVIQSMGTESNKEPQSNTFYKRFSKISWLPDQKSIADKQGTSMALSDNKNLTTTLPNSLESPLDPAESNFTPSNSRVSDTSSKAKSLAASQSEVSRLRQNTPSVHAMARSRRRIRKQLRLLFLYPVVYLLMWTIPLISHAFKYNDHYAKHPRYILTLLSVMCRILIGAIDCVVFCAREKPWRHIPGHDSTIMGSFLWWKRGGEKDRDESHRTSITALSTQDSSTMASPNPTEEISKPSKVSRRSGYYRQLSVDVCQDEINKVYERLKAEQLKNKTPDNSAS